MEPLDKDTLFSIFEQGDEQIYQEHGLQDTLNNPFVLMGMVIKGLENFQLMNLMYQRNYPKEYAKVASVIKYKYYTKLYNFLTRINLKDLDIEYNIGDSFEDTQVYIGLEELRVYYEGLEEYEKCGVIKKYIDYLIDKVVALDKFSYI